MQLVIWRNRYFIDTMDRAGKLNPDCPTPEIIQSPAAAHIEHLADHEGGSAVPMVVGADHTNLFETQGESLTYRKNSAHRIFCR
jgi:hypothetical protein